MQQTRLAIFGEICTHGLLYSVGRLPDRATDRAAYKKPKVQEMDFSSPSNGGPGQESRQSDFNPSDHCL